MTNLEFAIRSRHGSGIRRVLGRALVSLAALCVLGIPALVLDPALAHADKVEKLVKKAEKYLEKGDKRRDNGKAKRAVRYWEKALAAYQDANEEGPSPELVLAIARTEVRLERYMDAVGHLQKVIKVLEDGEVKSQAEKELEDLKSQVALVSFDILPEGAELSIDGQVRGKAPFSDPVFLAPGEHTFKVTAEGVDTHEETLTLEAGGESTRQIHLGDTGPEPEATDPEGTDPEGTDPEPEGTDPEPEVKEPDPEADTPVLTARKKVDKPGKGTLILGSAVTVGLLAGATVTGLSAISKHDQFEDPANSAEVREDARSSGKTLRLVTDLMLVAAVAAGSYTAYHYFGSYRPQSKAYGEQQSQSGGPSVVISPYVDGEGAGLAVTGRF